MISRIALSALLALAIASPLSAWAEPLKPVGQAVYKWGFFKIYTAELKAPDGRFEWRKPFALSLTYARSLKGASIANASIEEMARLTGRQKSDFEHYRVQLNLCFPDVSKGDVITGFSTTNNETRFEFNGETTCLITDPDFKEAFFNIWLAENARYSSEAAALLGRTG